MDQPAPPTLESDLLTGVYSDEEKAQILGQIEEVAVANRLPIDAGEFRPRKSGILFPVLVNLAAVVLVVGAWFGAEAWFQTRQEGLKLRTDRLFSTESKLLTQVLEKSKAQLAAKNAEIDQIKGDLAKIAAEKADLEKTLESKVASREKSLRLEMQDALAAEKKRLEAAGYGPAEVARRLKEFEVLKNTEFNDRLESYRRQAQSEIQQRDLAVTALQAKLQASAADQERLKQEVEAQSKQRERDLQNQLSSQASDLDQLKRERDELLLFQRQADASMAAVRTAFDSGDWTKTQASVLALRQVLAKASASASDLVRSRATAESRLVATLDSAVGLLDTAPARAETDAKLEAVKAQAKKEQALAALQLAETQKTLAATEAQYKKATADLEALQGDLAAAQARAEDTQAQLDAGEARSQALEDRIAALEKTVADLLPWKQRGETLQGLFTASYPSARERFTTTLGSEAGLTLFPKFDDAWRDLQAGTQTDAARRKALSDVLAFTEYLRGHALDPNAAKEAAAALARTDEDYRHVVESIQALSTDGAAESAVATATTQLFGSVAGTAGTRVLLEPLTKLRLQEGQLVELRRIQGKKETLLGRGKVLSVSAKRVEIDWTGNAAPPFSGDAAYLVLP